jgi:GNAT superfamily N-acetyltransferase
MKPKVHKIDVKEVQAFRILFLQENNFQFIYDKCHTYGWADTYLFILDDLPIGYGAIWGQSKREDRDAIFEFYIVKPYRKFAHEFFSKFQFTSGATFIECQSNDLLLSPLLFEYSQNINAEAILFEDHFQTTFFMPDDVIFQKKTGEENRRNDECEYILKQNNVVVATGGLMLNYNMPYADLYYEVNENYRQKGFGSLIVQELKKAAYLMGRVPAARCNINNMSSKLTLLKAGFDVCGYILNGEIKRTET